MTHCLLDKTTHSENLFLIGLNTFLLLYIHFSYVYATIKVVHHLMNLTILEEN